MNKLALIFAVVITISFSVFVEVEKEVIENKDEISIFVASSAKMAISNLANRFQEENKEINIEIYSMSSGKGFAQLVNGFKYDLYFSADSKFPQKVVDEGLSNSNPQIYGYGKLAIYSTDKNLLTSGFDIFTSDEVRKISIANPKLAPYGTLAEQLLKDNGIYQKISHKIVKGDNIAQSFQFVDTGSADIGIVALSLLKNRPTENYIILDENSYKPLEQSFVLTNFGEKKSSARKFYTFVLSEKGRKIIEKSGL